MSELFHQNPYLKSVSVDVLQCEHYQDGFRVALSETPFYPEGGGQPADYGWIGSARVVDVQQSSTCIWHYLDTPVEVGPAKAQLDWNRRYDHMQQHTGQHLFTAIALSEWGFATVGFHLGAQVVGIELETESLTLDVANQIADRVNQEITNARPLRSYTLEKSDFQSHGIRSRATPDHVLGPFRIIEIQGLDKNTCGGTHLSNTYELRGCVVLGVEKIRGRFRVNCIFGDRIIAASKKWGLREKAFNRIFSQGADSHVMVAKQWSKQIQDLKRQQKKLELELMTTLGQTLAQTNNSIVIQHREGAGLKSLSVLASSFSRMAPDKTLLLGGGQQGDGVFVIIAPHADLGAIKSNILSILDGSGGGKGARMQGKCSNINGLQLLLDLDFSQ